MVISGGEHSRESRPGVDRGQGQDTFTRCHPWSVVIPGEVTFELGDEEGLDASEGRGWTVAPCWVGAAFQAEPSVVRWPSVQGTCHV